MLLRNNHSKFLKITKKIATFAEDKDIGFGFTPFKGVQSFIHRPPRQLVGKTQRVFRRPNGTYPGTIQWRNYHPYDPIRPKAPAADGRPSGSSLQAVEEEVDCTNGWKSYGPMDGNPMDKG
jgi:hypothetical protein